MREASIKQQIGALVKLFLGVFQIPLTIINSIINFGEQ